MSVNSNYDMDRALHTLPPGLVVKPSNIIGAGLGVFTEKEIAPHVMFGPYGGVEVFDEMIAHDSGYCWQIYENGKPSHFVDAKDKATSNWMRYVNCAPSESEQNLVAFQFKGNIYYRSYKTIFPGTELLCWYGNEYGRELGLVRDKNLLIRPILVQGQECYSCVFCKTSFTTAVYNVRHLVKIHGSKKLTQTDLQVLDEWLRKNDAEEYSKRWQRKKPTNCQLDEHGIHKQQGQNFEQNMNLKHLNKSDIMQNTVEEKLWKSNNLYYNDSKSAMYNCKQVEEKRFKCTVCNYSCIHKGHMKTHMATHTGEKNFRCNVCSYSCIHKGNLKKHMATHTGEKNFRCNVCSYSCIQKVSMKTHMATHTGEKNFRCNVCSYSCIHKGDLKRHMATHTGEKNFRCNVCSYSCIHKGDLKRHMATHTGEKNFRCNVCNYSCIEKSNLKKHMATHTGEKNFRCNVCSYSCIEKGNLKRHMATHTGEKNFRCNICSYSCIQKGNLKKHMATHTGEKNFRCNVCSFSCIQKGDLKKHMATHTGEKNFRCNVCSYSCIHKVSLKNHMKKHAGEK